MKINMKILFFIGALISEASAQTTSLVCNGNNLLEARILGKTREVFPKQETKEITISGNSAKIISNLGDRPLTYKVFSSPNEYSLQEEHGSNPNFRIVSQNNSINRISGLYSFYSFSEFYDTQHRGYSYLIIESKGHCEVLTGRQKF